MTEFKGAKTISFPSYDKLPSPIYIATKEIQRRTHRKKRINKKWRKRYGCIEINLMPHNEVVMMDDGVIWMTKRTFLRLREGAEE